MKKILTLLLFFSLQLTLVNAQSFTGNFMVYGDADKFYPVIFTDGNWVNNMATELEIGRSSVHQDREWAGSVISKFRFHGTRWGNGSRFADADIQCEGFDGVSKLFIAGYKDASTANSTLHFIVWLKGGKTTYFYKSNTSQSPLIYDGIQMPITFQEENGPAHTYKTAIDSYVNGGGKSVTGTVYTQGGGLNYMAGKLGLGTLDTKGYRLAVNGNILASEIVVDSGIWPDYVFQDDYRMMGLPELESYIKENKHLPDMPSAKKAEKDGIDLGEMNRLLLKKVEELTLHVIELSKRLDQQNKK